MDSIVVKFVPGKHAYGKVDRLVDETYKVVSRTERFVTLGDQAGKHHRVRLRHDSHGNEWVLLFGRTRAAMIVRPSS